MANKNFLNPFHLVNALNMVNTITSDPVAIQYLDNDGFQVQWDGAATGVISIECSLNYKKTDPPTDGDWYALTFSPAIVQPAGSAGGFLINLNQVPYPYARLKWAPTTPGVRASLVVQDLTYTAVDLGPGGNDITIAYIDPMGNDQALSVVVTDTDIVVNMATDSGGSITSTAAQILAAIQASDDASDLVTVAVTGTGSNVQTAASETPLASGAGSVGNLDVWVCAKAL